MVRTVPTLSNKTFCPIPQVNSHGQHGPHSLLQDLLPHTSGTHYTVMVIMVSTLSNKTFRPIPQVHNHGQHGPYSLQQDLLPHTIGTQLWSTWSLLSPTRPFALYLRHTVRVTTLSNQIFCFIPEVHGHVFIRFIYLSCHSRHV